MAVDSPGADTAGNIRNESRARLNEVVAKTNIESEVVILDSFENRLRDRADIKLMIAAKPAIAANDSPSDALCQKQRTNLIISGRINRAKQIPGLKCEFDPVRIEFVAGGDALLPFNTGECLRAHRKSDTTNADAKRFH